jgi:hypothetical protein
MTEVELFHHTNIGEFLPLPLESRKCNTSHLPNTPRVASITFLNWKEQQIQVFPYTNDNIMLKITWGCPFIIPFATM